MTVVGTQPGQPCRRITGKLGDPELFAGKPCIGDMWLPPEGDRDHAGDVAVCDVCGAIADQGGTA